MSNRVVQLLLGLNALLLGGLLLRTFAVTPPVSASSTAVDPAAITVYPQSQLERGWIWIRKGNRIYHYAPMDDRSYDLTLDGFYDLDQAGQRKISYDDGVPAIRDRQRLPSQR